MPTLSPARGDAFNQSAPRLRLLVLAGIAWLCASPLWAQRITGVTEGVRYVADRRAAASPVVRPAATTEHTGAATLELLPATGDQRKLADDKAGDIPADFVPWWQPFAINPLRPKATPLRMTLDNVVVGTLQHSRQVRVLADGPVIKRTAIVQEQARFDVRQFAESKFVDTSDPVGNTLTTGGANRYIDQNAYYSAGLRKRGEYGGQFEVSQKYGYEDNNSIYFLPAPQGTARLNLSYTQPLLNGAGCAYNNHLIMLAEIETGIAQDQFCKDLQDLLVDVHRNYWNLYLQRAALLQRTRLQQAAVQILDELNARREVDVVTSQIARARAAIATREAAVIRYETGIRNAETRLIATLNDPLLASVGPLELLPGDLPSRGSPSVDLSQSLVAALQFRPEINQAAKEIREASIRADVSRNELLPVLNVVLGSYVSGLEGDSEIGQAWVDQFSAGRPTYSAGLTFEMPLGNRAAQARCLQRKLELRQATNSLQATTAQIHADVEIAAREVHTTYREMYSKYQAMLAESAQIKFLVERWRLLPGDQQVAGVVLEDLLAAQDRLADAEYGMASAQVAYVIAQINLKRATGTLLEYEHIRPGEVCLEHLPTIVLDKLGAAGVATPAAAGMSAPAGAQSKTVAPTSPIRR